MGGVDWQTRARQTGPQLGLALGALLACQSPARKQTPKARDTLPPASATPSPALSAAVSGELPPLSGVAWIEHLDLGSGHEAYVTPPLGAREPRPLMIAVHGAGDRPEWACGGWRMAASEFAFVACPQGLKMDAQRFAWDSADTIRKRVASTVLAARARFGRYIADGPPLYVGFSQGATLASRTLLDPAQTFEVLALAEGGYSLVESSSFLRQLQARGVRRVLLVCGNPGCFVTMRASKPRFKRAGLELLIGGDPRSGHNLNGEMQAALQKVWPEFVRGLPNWQGFSGR